MCFTKASIVLLYHRIFLPIQCQKVLVRSAIWFVFWWNLLYTIAFTLTLTIKCIIGKEDKVANQAAVLISAAVINVMSDLMIFIIPIMAIWSLQLVKKSKFQLSAVFGVGAMYVSTFQKSITILLKAEKNLQRHFSQCCKVRISHCRS